MFGYINYVQLYPINTLVSNTN